MFYVLCIPLVLLAIALVAFIIIWLLAYEPPNKLRKIIRRRNRRKRTTPIGKTLKVLTLNMQYAAGKDFVFWYDCIDGSGPDTRPTPDAIHTTLHKIAAMLADERPDIILLQEIDKGARRTFYMDQLQELMRMLPPEYNYYTSSYYWKAPFIPHPKVRGSVGMRLAIISRVRIQKAMRYALPVTPYHFIKRRLYMKRAVLKVELRFPGNGRKRRKLIVFNTHLEAFADNTDVMTRQVKKLLKLIKQAEKKGYLWILAGDWNLLPQGMINRLEKSEQTYYNPVTELTMLTDLYPTVPTIAQATGQNCEDWFTHNPNVINKERGDRTTDYFAHSKKLEVVSSYVRQHDTYDLSDHFPVIATFAL